MPTSLNLYVEQDARMVAEIGNHARPGCDGIIMKLGDPRDVLAVTMRSNPLAGGWLLDADVPSNRVVTWSGTLADDLFGQHPMTWMKAGQDAFASFCDDISPQLERHGMTLCLQPHARHVLSDAQSCARFARVRSGQPFAIAFSPASLLETSMMNQLEDHLRRAFEVLSALGDASPMLMLYDVAEENLQPLPLGRGVLPRALIHSLLEQYVNSELPVVLLPERIDEQLEWLGGLR
jgi:hypothetical protein